MANTCIDSGLHTILNEVHSVCQSNGHRMTELEKKKLFDMLDNGDIFLGS